MTENINIMIDRLDTLVKQIQVICSKFVVKNPKTEALNGQSKELRQEVGRTTKTR